MKNAVIIHGKASHAKFYDPAFASPSNTSWLPWLQKQLLMNDILAQTPEMPAAWKPEYLAWSKEFERFDITPETILVGHSCGAGFLVRWLGEHTDVKVGKVILVAPWIDPDKSGGMGDFFDFAFDATLSKRTEAFIIYSSDDDFPNAQTSASMINKAVPGSARRVFSQHGHFMEIIEFTALRDDLLM